MLLPFDWVACNDVAWPHPGFYEGTFITLRSCENFYHIAWTLALIIYHDLKLTRLSLQAGIYLPVLIFALAPLTSIELSHHMNANCTT